jgi:DNA invertase Pin-like site-specific DNA recombinase
LFISRAGQATRRDGSSRASTRFYGGLAEFERDLIRARTGEGRERAKARGVKLGRKPKLTLDQQREAIHRRDVEGETLADIARTYNVSRSTISRLTA